MDSELKALKYALEAANENDFADMIQKALNSQHNIESFLVSNELWGGAGSIADQAGLQSSRRNDRTLIGSALVILGRHQIKQGFINQRTELWVSAFEKIHAQNI